MRWRPQVTRSLLVAGGLLFCVTAMFGCRQNRAAFVTVFAASSLTDVMEALADSFEVEYGVRVRLNVAASSILARQIEYGANSDVFVSADIAWARHLHHRGVSTPMRVLPVTSHLVLARYRPMEEDSLIRPALGKAERLAIGDPSHVPAGMYARQWLECANLWNEVRVRIVPTLDVRAALAAVESGAADAAIVYAADVARAAAREPLVVSQLESDCQPRIEYAVLTGSMASQSAVGVRFADYISDPARYGTWSAYGFDIRPLEN